MKFKIFFLLILFTLSECVKRHRKSCRQLCRACISRKQCPERIAASCKCFKMNRSGGCPCGNMKNSRIIKGHDVHPHFIPFQVFLSLPDNQYCGGSLISPSFVLTAAHCTENLTVSDVRVTAGEHDLSNVDGSEEFHKVEKIIQHPEYSNGETNFNDLTILKLTEPAKLSKNIGLVCLPSNPEQKFDDAKLIVSGWGATEDFGISTILQATTVKGIDGKKCQEMYTNFTTVDPINHLCTYTVHTDACQGDSGGPVTAIVDHRRVLAGVVSFGRGCALPDNPGVNTRVTTFLNWIYNNTDAKNFQCK